MTAPWWSYERELAAVRRSPRTINHMPRRLPRLPEIAPLGLPRREVNTIARSVMRIDLPAGTRAMRQGHIGREWLLLVSGSLSVRQGDTEVRRIEGLAPVGEVGPGPAMVRTADVVAAEDSTVLVFGAREWPVLRDAVPRFRSWLGGFTSEWLNAPVPRRSHA